MVKHHYLHQFQGCRVISHSHDTIQGHRFILIIMKSNYFSYIYIRVVDTLTIVDYCFVPAFLKAFNSLFVSRVLYFGNPMLELF